MSNRRNFGARCLSEPGMDASHREDPDWFGGAKISARSETGGGARKDNLWEDYPEPRGNSSSMQVVHDSHVRIVIIDPGLFQLG